MEEELAVAEVVETSQQKPEVIVEVEEVIGEEQPPAPTYYTAEDLEDITPTDIDLDRVDPNVRPIVENTIRDYKALQADHTKKSQRLAELEKVPEPELYFTDDVNKDSVFKDYLKNPSKILRDINGEIAKLEAVIPDDGYEEYRAARQSIAYWNGIKDEFSEKRLEIAESRREREIADAKLFAELGSSATALLDYGKTLGFSEKDLKSKPELRASVKHLFDAANAGNTAKLKEKKGVPHKAATPAGQTGLDAPKGLDTSKMSDDEWFREDQKKRIEKLKKKVGGI